MPLALRRFTLLTGSPPLPALFSKFLDDKQAPLPLYFNQPQSSTQPLFVAFKFGLDPGLRISNENSDSDRDNVASTGTTSPTAWTL